MKYIFIIGLAVMLALSGVYIFITQSEPVRYTNIISEEVLNNTPQKFPEILVVGDIMMGRNVELLMDRDGDTYPFQNIDELLKSVDTVVGNLEGPVLSNHTRTASTSLRFNFHTRMPQVLADHNINIVSLANNHTYDFGDARYKETISYLTEANIESFGHPFAFGPEQVLRTIIENKKFIFVGFNITNPNFKTKEALEFVKNIPHASDEFFIVFNHGGEEYELHSNTSQQTFYRGLIDAGVDVVIGAHPHVTQEIEIYKNKAIFYSLGNFIFDQYFSRDVEQGYSLKISFDDNSINYNIIPIQSNRSKPQVMDGTQKELFLKSLANRSSKDYKQDIQEGSLTLQAH